MAWSCFDAPRSFMKFIIFETYTFLCWRRSIWEEIRWMVCKCTKVISNIIVAIHPSDLKQIKGCTTFKEMLKLEFRFSSETHMPKPIYSTLNGTWVWHSRTLEKIFRRGGLSKMKIEWNPELLANTSLNSLLSEFDNFRCAMISHEVYYWLSKFFVLKLPK